MIIEIKKLPRKKLGAPGKEPSIVIIKCDICGSIFERPGKYRTAYEKADTHRCSKKCTYGHRKSDGFGGHGAQITEIECTNCSVTIKRYSSQIQSNEFHGNFCNSRCYGSWKAKNPETHAVFREKGNSQEARAKKSRTIRRKQENGTYVPSFAGKKHTRESKKKMSDEQIHSGRSKGKNNPMYGKKHTDEACEAMSIKRAEMILAGKIRPYGKNSITGDYVSFKTGQSMFYRSSWELAIMKFLDENDNVKSYDYESVKIPYTYHGKKRWYIPDFIVEFNDGTKCIWEIKPIVFTKSEKEKQKAIAAQLFCESHKINEYQFITELDMSNMGITL